MLIYIDESGSFTIPSKQQSAISCVVALIVPESLILPLEMAFKQWKYSQFGHDEEIKGSQLSEEIMNSFLIMLSKFDLIVECECMELENVTEYDIEQHRGSMVDSLNRSRFSKTMSSDIKKVSLPLYCQSLCMSSLIENVIRISIPYFAQRFPAFLSNFSWIIDRKDPNVITNYELYLKEIIHPILQSLLDKEKVIILEGEDYSGLDGFIVDDSSEPDRKIFSINKMMQNIFFAASHESYGLQIVDIISSCIRRGIRSKLGFDGWKYLPSLIVRRKKPAIGLQSFHGGYLSQVERRVLINYVSQLGKLMLVPDEIKANLIKNKNGAACWKYKDSLTSSETKVVICS